MQQFTLDAPPSRVTFLPRSGQLLSAYRARVKSIMSDNTFPQLQQFASFFEKASRDNQAAFEAAVDTSVVVTKASLSYASELATQWGKLATDNARRFAAKTA